MQHFKKILIGAAVGCLALSGAVLSQVVTLPTVQSINPGDMFQDVVGGQPSAQSQYASGAMLQSFLGIGSPSRGNALIGGDATTNLWQRGTAGTGLSSATATYTGSADRWAYFTGASTEFKVIRSSTAADLPAGYQYAFKFQRTASQTGVIQSCMIQIVESVNSYQFQGATAELDFHAYTGANFSAASANMTAYIITGTGTDEGLSSLVAGSWTGQATATTAVISLGAVSTAGRYAAIVNIPAATTEIAVELCYKPVGTAGANDYIAFAGVQLVRNPANASFNNTTVGYSSTTANLTLAAFERRSQAIETVLQQRYYYRITETTAVTMRGMCVNLTSSIANCIVPFPVSMRTVPTMAYATGFAIALAAQTSMTNCTANATSTTATSIVGTLSVLMSCATSAAGGALGTATTWGDGSGTGTISASAEL